MQGSPIWIRAWLYKRHLYSSLSTTEGETSLCLLNGWPWSYNCHSGSAAATLQLSVKLNSNHPHSGSEGKRRAWVNWRQYLEQEFHWLPEGEGFCICLSIPWAPQAGPHLTVHAKLCRGAALISLMELDLTTSDLSWTWLLLRPAPGGCLYCHPRATAYCVAPL